MPGLIFNCESWTLTKTDLEKLEVMQIWALNKIVGLPKTTPSAAITHMETRIITRLSRQLNFLHKILNKENGNWTRRVMIRMMDENIGWGKQIK